MKIETKEYIGYEHLRTMCNIKNPFNSLLGSEEISPRANYIIQELDKMGVEYEVETFPIGQERILKAKELFGLEIQKNIYYNIIAKFTTPNPTQDALFFVAHHDVNNVHSENCNDNTASVCNLLDLAYQLSNQTHSKQRNVFIAFTDCEEFGGFGAMRLSQRILAGDYGIVSHLINLELTAYGDTIWVENAIHDLGKKTLKNIEGILENNYFKELVPFNDSVIFRMFGLDSLCIGTLYKKQNGKLNKDGWFLCHSMEDDFSQAQSKDMSVFVNFLKSLI